MLANLYGPLTRTLGQLKTLSPETLKFIVRTHLSHTDRVALNALLNFEQSASAREVARSIDAPVGVVRVILQNLCERGIAQLTACGEFWCPESSIEALDWSLSSYPA